ncbi:hypothetical protein HMPREF0765_3579 [Sphingobacterium spiritivorum ATCC 33300]|uniref:Uncharacterized protein n=1 Tax=Sphingobacterium spiritivorum ATCC 33300 TaxID=525372 RepID=C2G1X3_SPHSI|nr:hypothetical protein HMPREF0765_3579 [Sphingobacterium spiritivorum ATCC 33300]
MFFDSRLTFTGDFRMPFEIILYIFRQLCFILEIRLKKVWK